MSSDHVLKKMVLSRGNMKLKPKTDRKIQTNELTVFISRFRNMSTYLKVKRMRINFICINDYEIISICISEF
jgi:hypothetical protein